MYQLKSAYTDQTALVSKLLKEGWEPFAVIDVKVKAGKKLRMYFKKEDTIDIQPTRLMTKSVVEEGTQQIQEIGISKEDRADLLDTFTRFTQALEDWSEQFIADLIKANTRYDLSGYTVEQSDIGLVARPLDQNTLREPQRLREHFTKAELTSFLNVLEGKEFSEYNRRTKDWLAERVSKLLNEEDIIVDYQTKTIRKNTEWNPDRAPQEPVPLWKSEKEKVESQGQSETEEINEEDIVRPQVIPSGDQFRVVREDEELPSHLITTANRTPLQDTIIEELKALHGSVSILPGSNDESIRVMAGASIYTIASNGNFEKEDTGANTNALM